MEITADITRYFEEMRTRLDVAEKTKIEIDRLDSVVTR